jgi:hypothetical protein
MNWRQIGSQVVSTLLAVGPLGLAAKFYLDRSLKKLDAAAAGRLETLKDELEKKRDSRQALITQSNYATQKALEIEFKVIQDLQSRMVRLQGVIHDWEPYGTGRESDVRGGSPSSSGALARPLDSAREDLLRLCREMKPFFPEPIFDAITACLGPVQDEFVNILTWDRNRMTEAVSRSLTNRNQFEPLAAEANKLMRERLAFLQRIPE